MNIHRNLVLVGEMLGSQFVAEDLWLRLRNIPGVRP